MERSRNKGYALKLRTVSKQSVQISISLTTKASISLKNVNIQLGPNRYGFFDTDTDIAADIYIFFLLQKKTKTLK